MKFIKLSILGSIIFVNAYAFERTKFIMGTYISVDLPGDKIYLFKDTFNIFKEVDKKFSKYRPDSYVYKLNKNKKKKIDKEFFKLLSISIEIYKKTEGYFDISLGNLTKKYGKFYKKQQRENADSTGMDNIHISNGYVFLENGISLDFGGIGKGYAVDKVSDFLAKKGVKNAVIKASGDIRCFNICKICIKNPFKDGYIACFLTKQKDTSISTSGNYERFIKDKNNNHLINPKIKKSQKTFASITLIGIKNNTYLDAYSTAVSVMPEKKALKFLNENKIPFFIIKNDKTILKSKSFDKFIENFILYGF